jgi:hypothetical protein
MFHQAGVEGIEVGVLSGKGQISVGTMGGMPQRRFVMFHDEDADRIHEVFGDWLDQRAAAAGINLRGG